MRERTIWISAGLLGLAAAIALAVLTSHVSQPPVGIPGEPVSAGKELAPARAGATRDSAAERPAARTTTAPAPPAAERQREDDDEDRDADGSGPGSGDDDSGRGRGRGRGRGGDD